MKSNQLSHINIYTHLNCFFLISRDSFGMSPVTVMKLLILDI